MSQTFPLQRRVRAFMITYPWVADGWRTRLLFKFRSGEWYPRSQVRPAPQSFVEPPAFFLAGPRRVLAAAVRPFRQFEWQLSLTILLSVVAMVVLEHYAPFWYGGSDHADYIKYGYYLSGQAPISSLPQWRTPGMGLIHIISGTVLFDTWYGFKILAALFGMAVPVLTYLMVRPSSKSFALVAALIMMASMIGYIYAFQPLSDHAYYFFHALVLFLCVRYFYQRFDRSYALLISIVLSAAFLNIIRPVGAIIFWLFIATAAVAQHWRWRGLAIASVMYMTLMAGWVIWDRDYGANLGAMPSNFFPLPTQFSTLSERRLAEAYFSPRGLEFAATDVSANGHPSSAELRQVLRQYLAGHPAQWKVPSLLTPQQLFARYDDSPDTLLTRLFSDRNSLYFAFIVRTTQDMLGEAAGLALINDVAGEHGTTGLYGYLAIFFRDPTRLLLGAMPNFSGRFLLSNFYREPRSAMVVTGFPETLLTPDLGPATALLLQTMQRFTSDYPQYCARILPPEARSQDCYQLVVNGGRIDGHLDAPLNGNMDGYIFEVLTWYLGLAPAGRVYTGSSIEVIRRYPKSVLLFYDNFLRKTFTRDPVLLNDPRPFYRGSDGYFDSTFERQIPQSLTPGLARELQDLTTNNVWKAAAALHAFVYRIAPLFIFTLILVLPLFPRTRAAMATCCFLLLVYLQEVASISILSPFSVERYEGTFYLLPILITCIILGHAATDLSRRRGRSSASKQYAGRGAAAIGHANDGRGL